MQILSLDMKTCFFGHEDMRYMFFRQEDMFLGNGLTVEEAVSKLNQRGLNQRSPARSGKVRPNNHIALSRRATVLLTHPH
mgnify:CR=1 FL=1